MKCKCLSAPDYHREDCSLYDIFGNKKENIFEKSFNYFLDKKSHYLNVDFSKRELDDFLSNNNVKIKEDKNIFSELRKKLSYFELSILKEREIENLNDLFLLKSISKTGLIQAFPEITEIYRGERPIKSIPLFNKYIKDSLGFFLFKEDMVSFLKEVVGWDDRFIKDMFIHSTQHHKLIKDWKNISNDEKLIWKFIEEKRFYTYKDLMQALAYRDYLITYLKFQYNVNKI